MTYLSFLCLFSLFSILFAVFSHIYHGFVGTMVMLCWKLHSNHDSLPIVAGTQLGDLEDQMENRKMYKKFILCMLIPIVFDFLVETSFLAGWHSVGGSGK